MVERFLRRTKDEPRRGVALVSFTNVAIDEVRRRCTGREDALRPPHFVGTFDTFIHRFIVTPLYPTAYKVHPRYVQSWNDIQQACFWLGGIKGPSQPVQLAWFDFTSTGNAALVVDRLTSVRPQFRSALHERQEDAEKRAAQMYLGLLRRGTVTCAAARLLAILRFTL